MKLIHIFLFSCSILQAQIVYQKITPSFPVKKNIFLDLTQDGFNEISSYNGITLQCNGMSFSLWYHSNTSNIPVALHKGDIIGYSGVYTYSATAKLAEMDNQKALISPFPIAKKRYIGFTFTQNNQKKYGWISLVNNGTSFTFLGFAYQNTPDTPIKAGDKGAIKYVNTEIFKDHFFLYPRNYIDYMSIICLKEIKIKKITIFDLKGLKPKYTYIINKSKSSLQLDLPGFSKGDYLLEFIGDNAKKYRTKISFL